MKKIKMKTKIDGGCGDTIQEAEIVFGNFRQQLVTATFKMLENQSFDAEIAVADESVFDDVLDYSTVEKFVMSDAFADGQDGSGSGSREMVFDIAQLKLAEPGYSEGKTSLKQENV